MSRSLRSSVPRLLTAIVAALVTTDAVGGLWAVAAGVNSWAGAWGSSALLAAPAPMIAAQVLLTVLAVRHDRTWAAVPATMLAVACLVSVASGLFDGGLGHDRLTSAMSGFQVVLLTITFSVGVLATARAVLLVRRPLSIPLRGDSTGFRGDSTL